ncbi:hypothetical protein H9P43_001004 [Blastocladiella emersonii ATCC 22665]|nr:hypothetical protein H9P43_001004 [Blastocladiella emersonii ATCC 22665]
MNNEDSILYRAKRARQAAASGQQPVRKPDPPLSPVETKPKAILAALPRLVNARFVQLNLLFIALVFAATTALGGLLHAVTLRVVPAAAKHWIWALWAADLAVLARTAWTLGNGLRECGRMGAAALTAAEEDALNLPKVSSKNGAQWPSSSSSPSQEPASPREEDLPADPAARAAHEAYVYAYPKSTRSESMFERAVKSQCAAAVVYGIVASMLISTLVRLPIIYLLASPASLPVLVLGGDGRDKLTSMFAELTTPLAVTAVRAIPLVAMAGSRMVLDSATKPLFNLHLASIQYSYFVDMVDAVAMFESFQRGARYSVAVAAGALGFAGSQSDDGDGIITSTTLLVLVLVVAIAQLALAQYHLATATAHRHGYYVFPDMLSQHITGSYMRERMGRPILIALNTATLALRIVLWTKFNVVSTLLAVKNVFVIGQNLFRLRKVAQLRDAYRLGSASERRVCAMAEELLDLMRCDIAVEPADWKRPYQCDWIGVYRGPAACPLSDAHIYFRIHFPPLYPAQRPQLFLISVPPFPVLGVAADGEMLFRKPSERSGKFASKRKQPARRGGVPMVAAKPTTAVPVLAPAAEVELNSDQPLFPPRNVRPPRFSSSRYSDEHGGNTNPAAPPPPRRSAFPPSRDQFDARHNLLPLDETSVSLADLVQQHRTADAASTDATTLPPPPPRTQSRFHLTVDHDRIPGIARMPSVSARVMGPRRRVPTRPDADEIEPAAGMRDQSFASLSSISSDSSMSSSSSEDESDTDSVVTLEAGLSAPAAASPTVIPDYDDGHLDPDTTIADPRDLAPPVAAALESLAVSRLQRAAAFIAPLQRQWIAASMHARLRIRTRPRSVVGLYEALGDRLEAAMLMAAVAEAEGQGKLADDGSLVDHAHDDDVSVHSGSTDSAAHHAATVARLQSMTHRMAGQMRRWMVFRGHPRAQLAPTCYAWATTAAARYAEERDQFDAEWDAYLDRVARYREVKEALRRAKAEKRARKAARAERWAAQKRRIRG